MARPLRILMLGASYGSLLASKLLLAGHTVRLVCLPAEAELINAEGFRVRFPIRGRDGLLDVESRRLPGSLSAGGPGGVDPASFDLVCLAMQEPQYRSPGVRELLDAVAQAKVPCLSIMNMPPLAFLRRIPSLDVDALRDCYTDASLWDRFDPARITLCSPDAQAFRPPDEKSHVLQVGLPTNFKAARFADDADNAILRRLEADIDAARLATDHGAIELPVKLRVHESVYVPLAKWCMLVTGNYRCIQAESIRSIKDSVLADVESSRAIYDWVAALCVSLGASPDDLVPFGKYAEAASGLGRPSSVARALAGGAKDVGRVDRLVQRIAAQNGRRSGVLAEIVATVDRRLAANRSAH
jgi:hypothetical protein